MKPSTNILTVLALWGTAVFALPAGEPEARQDLLAVEQQTSPKASVLDIVVSIGLKDIDAQCASKFGTSATMKISTYFRLFSVIPYTWRTFRWGSVGSLVFPLLLPSMSSGLRLRL